MTHSLYTYGEGPGVLVTINKEKRYVIHKACKHQLDSEHSEHRTPQEGIC